MSEILSRLQGLADRDVYGGIAFGNMFRFMLTPESKPEIVDELFVDDIVALSSGVPFVGRVSIDDNDFWEMQSDEWKNANKDLCRDGCWFRVDEVVSTEFVDSKSVKVTKRRMHVTFRDDEQQNV